MQATGRATAPGKDITHEKHEQFTEDTLPGGTHNQFTFLLVNSQNAIMDALAR